MPRDPLRTGPVELIVRFLFGALGTMLCFAALVEPQPPALALALVGYLFIRIAMAGAKR